VEEEGVFLPLTDFLKKVPSVYGQIGTGNNADGTWWVKFAIDIADLLAWQAVQEFGYVLNYVSLNERLPTVFKPVSPPPYLNGGPRECLSWVIECRDPSFLPETVADWLAARLPRPVDDRSAWEVDE
jgi:hypothetical protein